MTLTKGKQIKCAGWECGQCGGIIEATQERLARAKRGNPPQFHKECYRKFANTTMWGKSY